MKSKATLRIIVGSLWLVAASIVAGCSSSPAGTPTATTATGEGQPAAADPGSSWTLAVEPVSTPAEPGATSAQITVEGGRAILSWLEPTDTRTTLKFAEWTGSGWSEPHVVASGSNLLVNSADVPSVRALTDGTLVAHWLQEDGPDPEAYKLPLSWSKDGGRTWSRPTYPNHDGTTTQHGFASLFQAPGAGLGLVWLDGRATSGKEPDAPDANMGLWAAVYGPDGKQINEKVVDTRVCECCQTAVATTTDGVIVAYRDRTNDEIRDIYVTRFDGRQWSAPVVVHDDGWEIDGCPVNGPAVDARGNEVAVAWFTAKTDKGQAFVAFSHDGGRTFGQPIRLDDQTSAGQVTVSLLADASAAVSYLEAGNRSEFRVRRVEPNGTRSPAVTIATFFGMQHPRLAQTRNELLFAWNESGQDGLPRLRSGKASVSAISK
jgi:BNR repeat-like domain